MLKNVLGLSKRYFSRKEVFEAPSLLDIGCRRIFNEEHDMFRESVRKFIHSEIVPHHEKYEQQGYIDRDLWLKAGEMGLLGISTPEYGHGGDILTSSIVWEELSYANVSGPGFPLHSDIIMPYISKYGSKEMKEKYLPKMTSGEFVGAIGMSEPGAGSDLQGIRTNAKSDGKGGFILNGSKIFISNGNQADVVIVVAITNPKAKSPAHGISLFAVENGMPGFKKGKILKKLGLKAQDTSELFFDDVHLTEENLVGELNKGFIYLMEELPRERLMIGAVSQCSSEFVFEETRRYVKERKAFAGTLSNLKTIQFKLAEMKTEISICRAFIDTCLLKLSEGTLDSEGASMAKYYASDLVNKICADAVQLHGGYGFMWDYPVCKAYADARVQTIYGGTNEIMKELIGRKIVK